MDKLNKNSGFKAPEGYFDDFVDKLRQRISEEDATVPNLDNGKKGFKVPDHYFETLNERIASKLKKGQPKIITLKPYKKYYLAVASVAAILLMVFGFYWTASSHDITFNDLASSDIESYFENNDLDLTTYEIAEVIPIDELEINDILSDKIDDETIIEYLHNRIEEFEELNLTDDDY